MLSSRCPAGWEMWLPLLGREQVPLQVGTWLFCSLRSRPHGSLWILEPSGSLVT